MKKMFLTFTFIIGLSITVQAQELQKAIGLRVGYGAELSYQHPIQDNTRLEAALGLQNISSEGFAVTGTYQWVFELNQGLNWYVGVGPQLETLEKGVAINGVGQIGIEYFLPSAPFVLSFDYRPSFQLSVPANYTRTNSLITFGLGARYVF